MQIDLLSLKIERELKEEKKNLLHFLMTKRKEYSSVSASRCDISTMSVLTT